MSKYEPLRSFLKTKGAPVIPMTFAEIEKVLGFNLPNSQRYPAWWSNNRTNNVMTNEWLAAGYRTEQVDVAARKLVFRRTAEPDSQPSMLSGEKAPRRHAFFGWMKGLVTIPAGTDLTKPADPEWGDIAWGEAGGTNETDKRR